MIRLIKAGCGLAAAILCATTVGAQTNKGAIDGTVTDQSGAVIPGATVTVVNLGTGESLTVTTSERGTFSFPVLDPVEYRIAVQIQGFKPAEVKRVKIDTATTATINV